MMNAIRRCLLLLRQCLQKSKRRWPVSQAHEDVISSCHWKAVEINSNQISITIMLICAYAPPTRLHPAGKCPCDTTLLLSGDVYLRQNYPLIICFQNGIAQNMSDETCVYHHTQRIIPISQMRMGKTRIICPKRISTLFQTNVPNAITSHYFHFPNKNGKNTKPFQWM